MRQRLLLTGCLAGLLCWGGLAGCTKQAVREKPMGDPLLTSKKPVEGKANLTEGRPSPHDQLLPPPPPPLDEPPSQRDVVRALERSK